MNILGPLRGLNRGMTRIRFAFWKGHSSYQERNRLVGPVMTWGGRAGDFKPVQQGGRTVMGD